MRLITVQAVFGLVAVAAAQDIGSIQKSFPSCVSTCLSDVFAAVKCKEDDWSCFCQQPKQVTGAVGGQDSCQKAERSCSRSDTTTFGKGLRSICTIALTGGDTSGSSSNNGGDGNSRGTSTASSPASTSTSTADTTSGESNNDGQGDDGDDAASSMFSPWHATLYASLALTAGVFARF